MHLPLLYLRLHPRLRLESGVVSSGICHELLVAMEAEALGAPVLYFFLGEAS